MQSVVINAVNGCLSHLIDYYYLITNYRSKKFQKENSPWCCRQSVEKLIPFSNLTDRQLNRLKRETYLKEQILFLDKNLSPPTNDYSTTEDLSKFTKNVSLFYLWRQGQIKV